MAKELTPKQLVELWENTTRTRPKRLKNGSSAGQLAPGLTRAVTLALRRFPNKDWEALFRRIAETPRLNGTPFKKTYAQRSTAIRRMCDHYEDSFKAPLLWVLDPKNIRDIEAGDYDTQQIESS